MVRQDDRLLSRLRRLAGASVLTLVLAAGGAAAAGWWYYTAPGPLPAPSAVVIPPGGYASTATALQRAGVLAPGWTGSEAFRLAVLLTRREGQIHAAELMFPAHASLQESLNVLRHGAPVLHRLTIPEGLTARQTEALINAAPFLQGQTGSFADGSVLPQTYSYVRDTDRKVLISRMQQAMQREVARIWKDRASDLPLTDPQQLVILASVVEKETAVEAERPQVAQVFLNRLRIGMKLQADPTTIYALTNGEGRLGRTLTHADMSIQSPYNTYVVTGLPPGPICSPGVASLEASAHPDKGDELYFVAAGDGTHRFTASLQEHNRNVSSWRAVREGKGTP